jgi:glycosyltransferase involved in cell wall biosynthesis
LLGPAATLPLLHIRALNPTTHQSFLLFLAESSTWAYVERRISSVIMNTFSLSSTASLRVSRPTLGLPYDLIESVRRATFSVIHYERGARGRGQGERVKILQVLYYYRPHYSGLTIYAERLAKRLAQRGHEVTVLTSRHDPSYPKEEIVDGVRVVRVPVAFSVSRGVVMPAFLPIAAKLIREHDIVHLHLPMVEAAAVAAEAKVLGKRLIITHHADLHLPHGRLNQVAQHMVYVSGLGAGKLADRIVANTHDRADGSHFIRRYQEKTSPVYPPIEIAQPSEVGACAFRNRHNLNSRPVVGFVGRFSSEKGCDYLLRSIPLIHESLPEAIVLFAGEYRNVVGETLYARCAPLLKQHADHVRMLGVLSDPDLVDFYAAIDVLALPSINHTETFGIVQVESMLCGTPVVASDLPGVREPVGITGMGKVVPPRNEKELASALVEVITNRDRFIKPREDIEKIFSIDATVDAYERIYEGESA